MSTTAEKLEYLSETKEAIAEAIEAQGTEVPEGTTFREYAELIAEIEPDFSTILDAPTVTGDLTYTGSVQTPTWDGYDSGQMTIGGTYMATNAGTYTATFTPNSGYTWADGTTAAKGVSWSISKATGTLTIGTTTLELSYSNPTGSISVTRDGDGTISASSSNTTVATVSVSGTTVTVTVKGTGSATITVSVAAGTNYTAPTSKTCAVTASFPSTLLSANSWEIISEVSLAGDASDYWEVGDEIDIDVDGETITLVIMGFNHDTKASGGTAGITFGMKNLMATTQYVNKSTTSNSGGFTGSTIYTWLQGTLLSSLSSDLQDALVSVNKLTGAGSASTTINTNAMKIFLFSEIEVFGTTTGSVSGEGSQYAYFSAGATKIKYLSNGTGSTSIWWERSPTKESSTGYCAVSSTGTAIDYTSPKQTYGVCFGFCV